MLSVGLLLIQFLEDSLPTQIQFHLGRQLETYKQMCIMLEHVMAHYLDYKCIQHTEICLSMKWTFYNGIFQNNVN